MSKVIHVTVAIENLSDINNFKHLPPCFTFDRGQDKVVVNIHHNPHAEFAGTEYIKNFDVLITPRQRSIFDAIQQHCDFSIIKIGRQSKLEQAVILAAVLKDMANIENFRHIKTYSSLENDVQMSSMFPKPETKTWGFGSNIDGSKDHVIKPLHGARGVGHIVFKPNEISLNGLLVELINGRPTKEQLEKDFPNIDFGSVNHPTEFEEGLNDLRNQGCILQEVVENIDEEFRCLVAPSGIKHFGLRKRNGSKYKQATGVTDQLRHNGNCSIYDGEGFTHWNELRAVLESVNMEFGSVDVFTTTDGKWGIFEWCNQFGTAAFNPLTQRQFHVDAVQTWVTQHLNMKGV